MAEGDVYPFNLGRQTRPVSTLSGKAQYWFDLGLNWCYGFNQEEGVSCFQKALDVDPKCVMAHWGIAYALGPFYNLVWLEFSETAAAEAIALAHKHIREARKLAVYATPVENRLVEALATRFEAPSPASPADYNRCDDNYAAAMRQLYSDFPDDEDVAALFAEALITRTPRRLWDMKTGQPSEGADTIEALEVCDKSIARAKVSGVAQHSAILHLHIHLLEMSHTPDQAMSSADTLATLCTDAGHLNHMSAHIYQLCGKYEEAKTVSEVAIFADDAYADWAGSNNFYVTARGHNVHLMMNTCMFLGQYEAARAAAEKMKRISSRDVLAIRDRPEILMRTEGYYAMTIHVLVRFGRWHEIINMPLPDDPQLFLVTTAMHHYARGVAYAALKNITHAEQERHLFHESRSRIPPDWRLLNNTALDMLAIAEKMLDGELAYHKGKHDEAYMHLRKSIQLDDALNFCEPWAWMHPPRHALGALLLGQGHTTDAELIYREDLGLSKELQCCTQHPDNVWALHGLVECLEARGETDELPALRLKLVKAMKLADILITSSCMCRTNKAPSSTGCCHLAGN